MNHPAGLTAASRYLILAAAFLGWMFSGVQMTITNLASGSATADFTTRGHLSLDKMLDWRNLFVFSWEPTSATIDPANKAALESILNRQRPKWYSFYNAAFLSGAALGGLVFGWLGDRIGRVKAMGASILWYSAYAGLAYGAGTAEQLLLLRFLSGMGVGGMWPTGVSLAAEAWSDVSRPTLAGLLGTAANVGIVLMSVVAYYVPLTPDSWRWIMLVGASPALLGVLVLAIVPESPAWLTARNKPAGDQPQGTLRSLFTPPLLKLTLIGIAIGTIPLLGGWGVTNWFIAWTEKVNGSGDYESRALASIMRASGGAIGSLLGGWIANMLGRRATYFFIALASFAMSEYVYLRMDPTMGGFFWAVFAVGGVSTIFFGWLPLYLPELFPTHVRATGAGISFNFGRILTAVGVLATGALTAYFNENYQRAGAVMSFIYAAGMIVILFAPDTTGKKLTES
ncbi:MAG TPA: MFS transporter [Pirellulaceae bacterium]|nr:MFS transporter [Pirellulaceae bacterium]